MPIEIQGPDGKLHSYPDGTSDDAIKSDMRVIYRGPQGQAPAPQRAGDPTALTGPIASPRMQTVQPYQNQEDWNQIALAAALGEKNRGIIQALQQTPGRLQRVKEAEAVGTAQGKFQELQRHGAANLRLLDQIRATFNEAEPDTQRGAIGPENTTKMPAKRPLMVGGYAIPFTEQPTTVDPRTGMPYAEEMTPVKRNAIVNQNDEKSRKAWDLQNRLEHDIEGLTTKFIMTAGAGANMSDARQKAFTDTIGAMIKAKTPEEFHNIANDAENILRETFGISMPQASNLPGIHPAAAQELLKDTSSRKRQQFDEIFGEGAADQIIRTNNARSERMDYGAGMRRR